MELELKHIAPYLPYKLYFLISESESKDQSIEELKSIDTWIKMVNFGLGNAKEFNEIKLILRPLSCLTKEIEIEGFKFVPAQTLRWSNITADIFSKSKNLTHPFNNLFICDYIKLLEWHFDVFGLINAGLAIDKKTL